MRASYLGLFVVEWTKSLEYGWLRLFVLLADFIKTYGSEDEWTFSVFSRCLVIQHCHMRERARNYHIVKCAGHSLREAVLRC